MVFSFEVRGALPKGEGEEDHEKWLQWHDAVTNWEPTCKNPWWKFWGGDPHKWYRIPGKRYDVFCVRCDYRAMSVPTMDY